MKKVIALMTLLVGLPLAASAAPNFYVGAGIGQGDVKSSTYLDNLGDAGGQFNDSGTTFAIFGGYQITDAVAVEIGFSDWGSLKDDFYGVAAKVQPQIFTIQGVGSVPIADHFSLFGKAGVAFTSIDVTGSSEGGSSKETINSQDLVWGGGVDYDLGQFKVRLEGEWINVEDTDRFVQYMLSGIFQFGK